MSWHYRLVKHPATDTEPEQYQLVEYYGEDAGYCKATFWGESPEEVARWLMVAVEDVLTRGILEKGDE